MEEKSESSSTENETDVKSDEPTVIPTAEPIQLHKPTVQQKKG